MFCYKEDPPFCMFRPEHTNQACHCLTAIEFFPPFFRGRHKLLCHSSDRGSAQRLEHNPSWALVTLLAWLRLGSDEPSVKRLNVTQWLNSITYKHCTEVCLEHIIIKEALDIQSLLKQFMYQLIIIDYHLRPHLLYQCNQVNK